MKGTFLFLGTGASAGVPLIGCKCEVCASPSPKDKRFRPSGLIRVGDKSLLIDTTPDLRSQLLQHQIDRVDGLLLTHTHFDHIAGIDDLRILNVWQREAIPCLLSQASLDEMKTRYAYFFDEQKSTAKFDFFPLEQEQGSSYFVGVDVRYCHFTQNGMKVTGFRVGDFAYISDVKEYDDSVFSFLKGIKTLVLSALKPEPSAFHLCFDEAKAFAKKSGAEKTWLTHLSHSRDHEGYNKLLPPEIRVAYDGLELEFTCTN